MGEVPQLDDALIKCTNLFENLEDTSGRMAFDGGRDINDLDVLFMTAPALDKDAARAQVATTLQLLLERAGRTAKDLRRNVILFIDELSVSAQVGVLCWGVPQNDTPPFESPTRPERDPRDTPPLGPGILSTRPRPDLQIVHGVWGGEGHHGASAGHQGRTSCPCGRASAARRYQVSAAALSPRPFSSTPRMYMA
ncbi:hypothetical protein ACFWWS_37095, partial [Streptomyces sp. NPDC059083]|uniref:hypothetical protein n=1 Tax=Streptomyces sp. NPDC059083 TaxID=3346721 RepID=UPI0036A1FE02